jgi:hypothetical protein
MPPLITSAHVSSEAITGNMAYRKQKIPGEIRKGSCREGFYGFEFSNVITFRLLLVVSFMQ